MDRIIVTNSKVFIALSELSQTQWAAIKHWIDQLHPLKMEHLMEKAGLILQYGFLEIVN